MNKQTIPSQNDLPAIAYILSILIGVLLFLLFGESMFGIKPNPIWIAGLMGLSFSAIVFWVGSEIYKKQKANDTHS